MTWISLSCWGSCRKKAGMGWQGGVCVWCLLQALVSATLLLPISDKLLSFSYALPSFKWGKIVLLPGSEKP